VLKALESLTPNFFVGQKKFGFRISLFLLLTFFDSITPASSFKSNHQIKTSLRRIIKTHTTGNNLSAASAESKCFTNSSSHRFLIRQLDGTSLSLALSLKINKDKTLNLKYDSSPEISLTFLTN